VIVIHAKAKVFRAKKINECARDDDNNIIVVVGRATGISKRL